MNALPDFARALLDATAPVPRSLRTWNGSDAGPRFDVYRNNVMSSLLRALEDAYPVCRDLVGREFFRAMAHGFVRQQPPASPVLLEYGAGFADFIAAFEPAASLAYLPDMARLERARLEAFHAADADPLPAAQFERWLAASQALMACHVRLHPSLRLLPARRPVLALWQAHQPGSETNLHAALDAAADGLAEDLMILRPGLEVRARVLPPGVADVLAALSKGQNLGEALAAGAAVPTFQLAAAVAVLVHEGATVALDPGDTSS